VEHYGPRAAAATGGDFCVFAEDTGPPEQAPAYFVINLRPSGQIQRHKPDGISILLAPAGLSFTIVFRLLYKTARFLSANAL